MFQVIVLKPLNNPLTYACSDNVLPGQIVTVPFRASVTLGVVWRVSATPYKGDLKKIDTIYPYIIPQETLNFIEWVAKYNMITLGTALKFCLSKSFLEKEAKTPPFLYQTSLFDLSHQQQAALESIKDPKPYVVDGVTGSGKTEVYFHALAHVLKQKKQGLVLLPEIALTKQWIERFKRAFGVLPLTWHSKMTPAQKRNVWQCVLKKDPFVVVGARSALFLPFSQLGMIVIDEEHDGSFKQNEPPLYNARDMAIVRAHLLGIPILLGSATPSLETYYGIQKKGYAHLVLSKRFGVSVLPFLRIVDMNQIQGWISPPVKQAIRDALDENTQILLYLNRRGYAPLSLCFGCGYKIECKSCLHPFTFHQAKKKLLCHHCGASRAIFPSCPACSRENPWKLIGQGIEKIDEIVQKMFPNARILSLSSDDKFDADQILNHNVDIIIGTQILSKGHHFPLLKRVVVLDADLGLSGYDFRGLEKTFQLLQQVSGRAGREAERGSVWVQTHYPCHHVFESLVQNTRNKFYDLELLDRKKYKAPPFSRYIAIIVSCAKEGIAEAFSKEMLKTFPFSEGISLFGPAPAPFAKLRGKFRWRFLLMGAKPFQAIVAQWLSHIKVPKSIDLRVDVDPYDFS